MSSYQLPNWPMLMRQKTACRYLEVGRDTLISWQDKYDFPRPSPLIKLYSKAQIDKWINDFYAENHVQKKLKG